WHGHGTAMGTLGTCPHGGTPVGTLRTSPYVAVAVVALGGIEPQGNTVLKPAQFTVETLDAGVGEVLVYIEDPEGHTEEAKVVPNNDKKRTYSVTYVPKVAGLHKVTVLFAGQNIDKSPFGVNVGMALGDASKVTARGPGLEPVGNVANKATYFDIYTAGAGAGDVGVVIVDPQGRRDTVEVMLEDKGDSTFRCTYRPALQGTHLVHVTYAGAQIPRSPFTVNVAEACSPAACRASGRGLQPKGVRVQEAAAFRVFTKGAGTGELSKEKGLGVDVGCMGCGVCWGVGFQEQGEGAGMGLGCVGCLVQLWGAWGMVGCGVQGARRRCWAWMWGAGGYGGKGSGVGMGVGCMGYGVPGTTQDGCYGDRNGVSDKGVLGTGMGHGYGDRSMGCTPVYGARGPWGARREDGAHPRGSVLHGVRGRWGPCTPQHPTDAGAPQVNVGEGSHPGRVRVHGPGVEKTGLKAGEPTYFTVDCSEAGQGDVSIGIKCAPGVVGPLEADIDFDIIKNDNDTFTVKYTPPGAGLYTIMVLFANQEIPSSPFRIKVDPCHDSSKVKAEGPGLSRTGVEVGKPTHFTVHTKGAGKAKLDVQFAGPGKGPAVRDFEVIDNHDYSYTVKYTALQQGNMTVVVTYGGDPVPKSPFSVNVAPALQLSKVKVQGLSTSEWGRRCGAGRGHHGGVGPPRCGVPCGVGAPGHGTPMVMGCPMGWVCPGERHIPGSPFKADVRPVFDPSKVTASGPGLERGKAGEAATFLVDCSKAGDAELTIEIISDSGVKAEVLIQNNRDGTYAITYTPACPGSYTITIKYGGHPVPKFPIRVTVDPAIDTSGVKVYGKGVEPRGEGSARVARVWGEHGALHGCLLPWVSPWTSPSPWAFVSQRVSTDFTVDARALTKTGGPHVKARVLNPSGAKTDTYVTDHGDGTYRVHHVEVTYKDVAVPLSPFRVAVAEGCEPTRVRAHGPGLEGGLVGTANCFTVETRGAGTGGLGLAIEGPSEAKMSCKDNKDGSCTVEYIPFTPGDYDVNITFGGHPIPGSPFRVPVQDVVDPSKVKCSGPGLGPSVRARLPQTFTVDCSAAGLAPLEVTLLGPTGLAEPVEVRDNGDGTHKVTYTPATDGPYTVAVKYADQEVPRSPFKIKVLPAHDASKVRASGPGLSASGIPASLPVEFTIDARNAGEGLLTVQILDPEGQPKKAAIRDNGDGTYTVSYVPDLPGRYTITIKYGGDEIPCSPFRIHAVPSGDASKCLVTGGPCPTIGEETVITVDAKAAGQGKVTCKVSTPDGAELDVDVVENHDGTFDIYYTAPEPGKYVITIRFGGEHVPNSPFHVLVGDHRYGVRGAWCGAWCGARCGTLVSPRHPGDAASPGEVRMPSGKTARPNITDNKDGTVTVRYAPTEKGLHEMDIRYDGNHIPGSPLQFYVDAINPRHVSAYGPGLSHGMVNKPCTFTIVTKDAGEGGLSLAVEGPSKAEITCKDNKDGTCTVSYLPTAPGDYNIIVRFDDKHIPGSPFTAKITGDDSMRTSQLNVGTSTDVSLKITETDLSLLTASIRAPSGNEEPCLLKRLPNRHIGISFTPKEVGEHVVSVKKSGQHVTNSPFKILVGQSEIGDASRVKVWGKGLVEGHTFEVAEFIVDTRNAGYGGLGLSIEGPSKVDINCEDVEDGTCKVTYCPTEPGNYIINIKFADKHVPGSPFTVKVTGEGRMKESITRRRQAPSIATIGSTCDLNLKIPALCSSVWVCVITGACKPLARGCDLTACTPRGACWAGPLHWGVHTLGTSAHGRACAPRTRLHAQQARGHGGGVRVPFARGCRLPRAPADPSLLAAISLG
uniref:Filamin C n=1 Tax=Anser brachyrhynchus TaxID=132585 RepID=A0A8B9I5S9_9AVES